MRPALLARCLLVAACTLHGQTTPTPLPRSLPTVELEGTGYERGLQHGRALRSEIATAIRRWKEGLAAQRRLNPDAIIDAFLRETDFLPAIRRWTPDLLAEVRGIAEGSGQRFETLLAYQCVDELWNYLDEKDAHHCSGIGVARRGEQPALVSQNMDLEIFRHGSQTLLHLRPSAEEPEQFVLTCAGLIALNGLNQASIAVCVNTLMQLNASRDGLPVAFVIRGLLARTSEESVLAFLTRVKHASGQNYLLGIGDKVFDFEASPSRVVRFQPVAGGSPVFHTNHPLANRDLKPWHARRPEGENSLARYRALQQRVGRKDQELDERALKAALASKDSAQHPVCVTPRPGSPFFTFASVLMTLSSQPTLQITYGPPDASAYVTYAFAPPATHGASTGGPRAGALPSGNVGPSLHP